MKPTKISLALTVISASMLSALPATNTYAASSVMLSATANRSSAVTLNGKTVNGQIYVFATSTAAVKGVRFYLDDPKMAKTPITADWATPFDYAGSTSTGLALPYDASKLNAGSHSITARVSLTTGAVEVVTAAFTKGSTATPTPTPTPTPTATPAPTPAPTAQPYGKKWHPGHYLSAAWGTDAQLSTAVNRIKNNPNLKGFAIAVKWAEIEPSKGVYNFSRINAALNAAKAVNKQVMVQIYDHSFHGADCVPTYMKTDPIYKGGQYKPTTRCWALRWVPAVQDRLIAVYGAIGKQFNSHPNFEAFYTGEDAAAKNAPFYSDAAYVEQQKRGIVALGKAFPNTVVFKFLNWGPGIDSLFSLAHQVGIGVGGPDVMPHHATWSTPYYPKYAGRMPLHIAAQSPKIIQTVSIVGSVEKVYDFAINDPKGLNANYLVWDQPEDPNLSYSKQILPVINAHKGYINNGCPLNMTCK